MIRLLMIGCLTMLLMGSGDVAWAAESREAPPTKTYHPADKFVRGLVNIATAPLEMPRHIRQRTSGGNTFRNWVVGVSQGLGYTVTRALAGAYEVLTFPVPAPKRYAPVIEPEYLWETAPATESDQHGRR